MEGESRTALQRTGTTVSRAGDTQGANQAHLQHNTLTEYTLRRSWPIGTDRAMLSLLPAHASGQNT